MPGRDDFEREIEEMLRPRRRVARPLPPPPPPEPEISDLQRYLAMGARGVGALTGIGAIPGAIGGGLGETAAQMIEKGTMDPTELNLRNIAAEAGVGAVGGKYARLLGALGGRVATAAGLGALTGAAAPVIRHGFEEGEWDPREYAGEVGTSAALSGATGGALSGLMGLLGRGGRATQPGAATAYQVEPTMVPGGRALAGGRVSVGRGGKTTLTGAKPGFAGPGAVIRGTGITPAMTVPAEAVETVATTSRIPYMGTPAEASSRVQRVMAAEEKAALEAQRLEDIRTAREAAGVEAQPPTFGETVSARTPEGGTERMSIRYATPEEEADEATKILLGQAEAPVVPTGPGAAEVVVPPVAEAPAVAPAVEAVSPLQRVLTPKTRATRIRPSKTERFDQQVAKLLGQVEEGVPPVTPEAPIPMPLPEAVPVPEIPPVTALSEAPAAIPGLVRQLENLQPPERGLDILGSKGRYGRLQALFKAGQGSKEDARAAGALTRYAAGEVGLPTGKAVKVAPEAPVAPPEAIPGVDPAEAAAAAQEAELARVQQELATPATGPSMTPEQVQEQQNFIDRITKFKRGGKEKGEIPVELLARLGLGAAGAVVGGATDPLGDPTLSALAGAGVGAALPSALPAIQRMGERGLTLPSLPTAQRIGAEEAATQIPEQAQSIVSKMARLVPQVQRANFLTDAYGLPANVIVGPLGSGFFGSLERAMAGDPRGQVALRELLNPKNLRDLGSSLSEAKSLMGIAERGESAIPYSQASPAEQLLHVPGTAMTAGDVYVRRILERAGFSEDEARAMTLTSEPFTRSGQSIAHLRGLIPDITLPFKRTPVNIMEQGALRTPVLGSIVQGVGAARGTRAADPLRQQLIQQGIGLGVLGGSEQIGENMSPEQARIWRRYVTNVAGPYSLLAGAGLAAGMGAQRGQAALESVPRNVLQQLPLPTIDVPLEWSRYISGRQQELPRGAYPSFIRQLRELYERRRKPESLFPTRRR